jgi:tetratricopeptide (TPR) repeat protein
MLGMRRRAEISAALVLATFMAPPAQSQFLPASPSWSGKEPEAEKILQLKSLPVRSKRSQPRTVPEPAPSGDPDTKNDHPRLQLVLPGINSDSKLLREGDLARESGQYDRALQIFRYLHRRKPHDSAVVTREAEILYRLGKNAQAAARAGEAIKLNAVDVDAHLVLAQSLLAQGKNEAALKVLEQAEAIGALQKQVHRLLAHLYARSGSSEKSDYEFRRVLELDSSDIHAATNIAAHLAAHTPAELVQAINLCRKAVAEQDSPQLEIQLGLLYMQQRRYGESADAFKRARDLDPHDPLPFEMLAYVSGARQDWAGAQDFAQSFVDVDGGNINAQSLLSWCTYAFGEMQDARSNFQRTLETFPGSSLLHDLYALVLIDSRRYKDAADQLQSAKVKGTAAPASALIGELNRIMLMVIEGKAKSAAEDADRLLTQNNNIAPVVSLAAFAHLQAGETPTARQLAEYAVTMDREECLARLTLSQIARDAGDYNQALHELDATGFAWKGTSLVLTARARIFYESGDYAAAHATAQWALQIAPSSLPAKEVLAFSLAKQGNYEGAALFLKELVARNPKDMQLRMTLADCLERKGDIDGAQTVYENAHKLDGNSALPLVGMAHLALRQGKFSQARKFAQRARAVDDASLDSDAELARLMLIRGAHRKR